MVFNTIQTSPLKIIKTHAPFSVIAHPSLKEIRALLIETWKALYPFNGVLDAINFSDAHLTQTAIR